MADPRLQSVPPLRRPLLLLACLVTLVALAVGFSGTDERLLLAPAAVANFVAPRLALLWSDALRHPDLGEGRRCRQPHLNTHPPPQLRRLAPNQRTGSRSSSACSTDSLTDRRPLSTTRRISKTRRSQRGSAAKGRVAERAENRRSDSSLFAPVRYGAIRTSTVGGFALLLHPAERHDEVMLDFSAESTLSPQRNFTATQPTR